MESRTASLVLRLLQRHLPTPTLKHFQSELPALLPRIPHSFDASAGGVSAAAGKRLLDFVVARPGGGGEVESGDVERTTRLIRGDVGVLFKRPDSPFLAFDRASGDAVRALHPSTGVGAVAVGGSGVVGSEPVWRFELGIRMTSGMYMPTQRQEEEGWEASSVKRKRKKKMNKHKQRKLRRRDRHRN